MWILRLQRYRTGHVAHACDGKLLRVLRLFAVVAFAVFDIGYNLVHSTENDGVSMTDWLDWPKGETRTIVTPRESSASENAPQVSVWAHGFGCLAGVMFGLVLLKDSREEVGHWKLEKKGLELCYSLLGVGEECEESQRDNFHRHLPCHGWPQCCRILKYILNFNFKSKFDTIFVVILLVMIGLNAAGYSNLIWSGWWVIWGFDIWQLND